MQTQMYARCFELGDHFYPAASAALFLPGILIQLIQSRYDKLFDRKYTTYRAANARILLSIFCKRPAARRAGQGRAVASSKQRLEPERNAHKRRGQKKSFVSLRRLAAWRSRCTSARCCCRRSCMRGGGGGGGGGAARPFSGAANNESM
jgi:hypothetical protein